MIGSVDYSVTIAVQVRYVKTTNDPIESDAAVATECAVRVEADFGRAVLSGRVYQNRSVVGEARAWSNRTIGSAYNDDFAAGNLNRAAVGA